MNYDEFAFFNQQLASMLHDGIPLEGALKQLASGMRDSGLRAEIDALRKDLANGIPLPKAMQARNLPDFYRRMVEIGARSNDLPGLLTVIADHYHRVNAVSTRLKGLMIYPILVIGISLLLTLVLTSALTKFLGTFSGAIFFMDKPALLLESVWVPPVMLAVLACAIVAGLAVPRLRARLRWTLPAFREASLAQLASAMSIMLKQGMPMADALALAGALEAGSPAEPALGQWRSRISAGQGKASYWSEPVKPIPALFVWLVQQSGEDPAAGFLKAHELYRARAAYKTELALYGALPISILFLGQMVLWQVTPVARALIGFMNALGGDMGDVVQ